jgi:uncharacterized protein involved in exopolysaccharide biosynthesis
VPGAWLLAIARFVFDEAVLKDVVHQTIADLRSEWIDAGPRVFARWRARCLGYVAFWSLVLISPVAFRKWSGRGKTGWAFWQLQGRFDMRLVSGIRLATILFIVGLVAGYVVFRTRPVEYRSSALLQVVPPRIPPGILDASRVTYPVKLDERLRSTSAIVLSRTRLERVIREFNLYETELRSMTMEEVVSMMRGQLSILPEQADNGSSTQIVVGYTGSHPTTVMKVTEKVSKDVIEESLRDAQRRAEGTQTFLESEVHEMEQQLMALTLDTDRSSGRGAVSTTRLMEIEVAQDTYKTLLARQIEARMMVNLERRQIGEQFVLLDAARLPERPIGPTRLQFTLAGGAAGLVTAALIALVAGLRRILRDRRRDLATAT